MIYQYAAFSTGLCLSQLDLTRRYSHCLTHSGLTPSQQHRDCCEPSSTRARSSAASAAQHQPSTTIPYTQATATARRELSLQLPVLSSQTARLTPSCGQGGVVPAPAPAQPRNSIADTISGSIGRSTRMPVLAILPIFARSISTVEWLQSCRWRRWI